MKQLISPDNVMMQLITKMVHAAYLNILWFLCCLPVVTVGASTTALYYVTLKMVKNEEGNITQEFFHSFRENVKQGTVIWLLLLALGLVLGLDGFVLYHMYLENAFWTVCTAIFLVAAAAYVIVLLYVFPLLARFSNTTPAMLGNALMIGMRFLYCTALLVVIHFVMAVVVIRVFTPAIVFGEGLCAFFCSYLLSNILSLCEEKSTETVPAGGQS